MSSSPRWSVEGRDWPHRAHSQFIDCGGLRWHVQVMGEGPPLLLLHGTGAATHSWRDLAPLLAKEFTVIAPDLPGHGFTSGRPAGGLTMSAMARAMGELLHLMNIEPEVVVGHSAGAAIAIRMTLDEMVAPRAIAGLSAALLPFPGLAAKLFPALAKLLFVNPFAPHLFARMARVNGETNRFLERATGSHIDAEGVALYQRLMASPGHVTGAITMMAEWNLDALKRDLPRLQTRVLLIHGEGDAAIPVKAAAEAADLIDGGTLVTLPGIGHLAHEERPEEVAKLILDFVGAR